MDVSWFISALVLGGYFFHLCLDLAYLHNLFPGEARRPLVLPPCLSFTERICSLGVEVELVKIYRCPEIQKDHNAQRTI